jgi:hypothetical protein
MCALVCVYVCVYVCVIFQVDRYLCMRTGVCVWGGVSFDALHERRTPPLVSSQSRHYDHIVSKTHPLTSHPSTPPTPQGVHMLFGATVGEAWAEGEVRESRFVFIGRDLDRKALTDGFNACLITEPLRFEVGTAVRCKVRP